LFFIFSSLSNYILTTFIYIW